MSSYWIEQEINYNLTAGSTIFPAVELPFKEGMLTVQIVYNNLDADDAEISLMQKRSGQTMYEDVPGSAIKLDSNKRSAVMHFTQLVTKDIRLKYLHNSVHQGLIEKVNYVMN